MELNALNDLNRTYPTTNKLGWDLRYKLIDSQDKLLEDLMDQFDLL